MYDQDKCQKGCFGTSPVYLKVLKKAGDLRVMTSKTLYETGNCIGMALARMQES